MGVEGKLVFMKVFNHRGVCEVTTCLETFEIPGEGVNMGNEVLKFLQGTSVRDNFSKADDFTVGTYTWSEAGSLNVSFGEEQPSYVRALTKADQYPVNIAVLQFTKTGRDEKQQVITAPEGKMFLREVRLFAQCKKAPGSGSGSAMGPTFFNLNFKAMAWDFGNDGNPPEFVVLDSKQTTLGAFEDIWKSIG
ncbi:MAG: hypothetical protein IPG96_02690 [Proteobacteria bacterium]|nr:hypothetical protein [Pseudomonadota bacterium]